MAPQNEDSRKDDPEAPRRSLMLERAIQLRAKALRWALGKCALGATFLVGAVAYALAPDRGSPGSRMWMTLLLILSTLNMGMGLRTFSRAHRGMARYWITATAVWGVFSTVIVRMLMRR